MHISTALLLWALIVAVSGQKCSQVEKQCKSTALPFCSSYITASAHTTRYTTTLSTITYVIDFFTSTTVSTCATPVPSTKAKRWAPGETPAAVADLSPRSVPLPKCLSAYDDTASHLSSACSCFSIADSTYTRPTRTVHVPNPSTTTISETNTLSSAEAVPTCQVTSEGQDGQPQIWKSTWNWCNTARYGGDQTGFFVTFKRQTLCEALDRCASYASNTTRVSTAFEVEYTLDTDGTEIWGCTSYTNNSDVHWSLAENPVSPHDFGYILDTGS